MSEGLSILRVAQKVYPDVVGGGPYHVHAMSRDQAAMGHDVTVLTVDQDGDRPRREERDGYTVVRYPATVEPLGNAISVGVARYLRRADAFDVVHAHSHLYFSTNLAAVVRRLGGPPLAVTNHGLYSQTAPEWVFDAYLRTLGRWTFDQAEVVFCYTETDRSRLADLGVSTPVEVVPNGIDTSRFHPDGPGDDRIDRHPSILFVGRLVEGKRPRDAVRALAAVRDAGHDGHLYFVGDGPLKPDLESLAVETGVRDAVHFLGRVDYGDMPAVYRASDVLVLPSRAEGLPRTVLEALATETPAVTSDLPQLRDLTNAAGAAVPVGAVSELATALEGLLADGDRRAELGAEGRERVVDRNAWRDTVHKTTDALRRLDSASHDG